MTPTPDLTSPDVVILVAPSTLQHYARLLTQALETMPTPDPDSHLPGARASAHVETVAHALADDILTSAKLIIDADRQIHIHMPKEVISP